MKRINVAIMAVVILTGFLVFILLFSSQRLANFYFSMMAKEE